jgi:hypothetical protein
MDRKRLIWVSGVIVGYAAAYTFWRNIALFELNVGEWAASNFLIPAALIGVITAFFQKYWFAVISFTGFNAGIVIGGLLGVISYDPGGGRLHNGWLLWMIVTVASYFAGAIAQWATDRKKRDVRQES